MSLEERIEQKRRQKKLIDAEIKFLQAQLEHRQSKKPISKPNEPAA